VFSVTTFDSIQFERLAVDVGLLKNDVAFLTVKKIGMILGGQGPRGPHLEIRTYWDWRRIRAAGPLMGDIAFKAGSGPGNRAMPLAICGNDIVPRGFRHEISSCNGATLKVSYFMPIHLAQCTSKKFTVFDETQGKSRKKR